MAKDGFTCRILSAMTMDELRRLACRTDADLVHEKTKDELVLELLDINPLMLSSFIVDRLIAEDVCRQILRGE